MDFQSFVTAFGLIKEAEKKNEEYKDSGLQLILTNLQKSVSDARLETVRVQNELTAALQELNRIKTANETKAGIVRKEGMIYSDGEGPYCAFCYGDSGNSKLLPLKPTAGVFKASGTHYCNKCKQAFGPRSNMF